MILGRKAVLAEILSAVGPAPQQVAFCGPPALGQVLAQAGHVVLACGQRVARLQAARRRALKASAAAFQVLRADQQRLPLRDGALDAVIYAGALPAAPKPIIAEWERALRDGGRVVVAGSMHAGWGARLRARLGGARLRPLRAQDYTRLLLCGGFADISQVWPRGALVITAARARKV
ncbi:MAG: methyltransferase domain-containing protein [Deltaproteobacteria bacterium]|nr:methyltransferase domain-containing protein [Deltaproteobacteria bacterium]